MLLEAFAKRYPGDSERRVALRARLGALCSQHLDAKLADNDAEQRLCSSDDAVYFQQISEMILAEQLRQVGLAASHANAGPDFLVEHEGRRIWIEVICPEPIGIPSEWLTPELGKAYYMPGEAILLRWTAAIKEKAEKLRGAVAKPESGYLTKGLVAADDIYVIAINARLLRGAFPTLEGISQFPFAVEATFCVGPYAVTIDRERFEVTGGGHQHRPLIPKPNGAQVPADTFFDPRFAPVSAIWATDIDESILLDNPQPMVVVHNPIANNPLPTNLLPAGQEYVAFKEVDRYRIDRVAGRLAYPRS